MAKIRVQIKNRRNQPFSVNLTPEESVRFGPKEVKEIDGKYLEEAVEIKRLIEKKDLVVIRLK